MKTWNNPELVSLDMECTEYGRAFNTKVDEVRVDQNNQYWYSYSGNGDQKIDGPIIRPTNEPQQ